MAFKTDANWSGLFRVEIENIPIGEFQQVKLPSVSVETIEYHVGLSKTPRKRPGPVKYENISLRRGYTNTDVLQLWWESIASGKDDRRSISIVIVDEEGNDTMIWNCYNCWPCRWNLADLEAGSTSVSIEEIEIVTERIERAR